MWKVFVTSYAFMATMPVITFFLVYGAALLYMERKKAIRLAMDITNFFLIGSVAALINNQLNTSFGLFFLILIMLIGGGLIGNAQNRTKGKVDVKRLFRAVWRLSFFGMVALYIPLMLLELIFFL